MKKAVVNWIALGIESANPNARNGATKQMYINDIKNIVKEIPNAGKIIHNIIIILNHFLVKTLKLKIY